jgi:CheY-like chemotaxis protein
MKTIKNIVLIDDNKIDCYFNQKICSITFDNVKVKSFNNSSIALEYFAAQDFLKDFSKPYEDLHLFTTDFILLDINMPIMNGFEFLKEMAKLEEFKKKPIDIYFLSSSNNEKDIKDALKTKYCSGYITKPLTRDKLIEVMQLKTKDESSNIIKRKNKQLSIYKLIKASA